MKRRTRNRLAMLSICLVGFLIASFHSAEADMKLPRNLTRQIPDQCRTEADCGDPLCIDGGFDERSCVHLLIQIWPTCRAAFPGGPRVCQQDLSTVSARPPFCQGNHLSGPSFCGNDPYGGQTIQRRQVNCGPDLSDGSPSCQEIPGDACGRSRCVGEM